MLPEDQAKLVFYPIKDGEPIDRLPSYLDAIARLTDIVLEQENIDPEWLEGGSKTMLKLLRQHDQAKAAWLRRYLNDELPADPLAPSVLAYRPHAEASLAKLRLAQEVFDRDPDGWAQQLYNSAAQWWFSGELVEIKAQLKNLGILDRPTPIGKAESYSTTIEAMEYYELQINGTRLIGFQELKELQPDAAADPNRILFLYAAKIAHDDYHFGSLFYQQRQAIKRAARAMTKTKDLKSAHVDEKGQLKVAEKGKGKRKLAPKKGGFRKET